MARLRKTNLLALALALILSFSLFATAALTYGVCNESCCCGTDMQARRHAAPAQLKFDRNCCATSALPACDLENKQRIELPPGDVGVIRVDNQKNDAFLTVAGPILSNENNILKYKLPWSTSGDPAHSSTIYLENRTLRI